MLIVPIAVLGFFAMCWLLFSLAIYALPFYAGLTAFLFALENGAGVLGAIAIGFAAGAAVLVIGQLAIAASRLVWLRLAIALLFAAPAALAGYYATHGLSKITGASEPWSVGFSIAGAIIIGVLAWGRMAAPPPGPVNANAAHA